MYTLPCPSVNGSGILRAKLRRQLESEFGTKISTSMSMQETVVVAPTVEERTLVEKAIKRQMIMSMLGGLY